MKTDQYYYNSTEYKEKLEELEERKAEMRAEREAEAAEKKKKVKSEILRLKKIFNDDRCGKENKHFVQALIERAAFLRIELEYIENTLQTEGVMDFFTQGLQTLWREHPLSKVHVQYVKNYKDVITKLESYGKQEGGGKTDDNPIAGLIGKANSIRSKYQK